MRTRRPYKQMTEKDFKMIRLLLEADLSGTKIHDITGRSNGTIDTIRKCHTFEEYKEMVREIVQKYAKPVHRHEEPENEEIKTDTERYDARFEIKLLNRLDTIITLLQNMGSNERKDAGMRLNVEPKKNWLGL